MLPLRGLGSVALALALTMGPATGCSDDLADVVPGGSTSSSTGSNSTGPVPTTGVDTTAGSMSDSMGSTGSSSSSGEPGSSSGTTQGVSASGSSSSEGTSSGSSSDATSSDATTSDPTTGVTTGMTTGMTTAMTTGVTDMGTTDLVGTSTDGTTDATTGGTTDMTSGATDDGDTDGSTEVPDFSGDFLFVVSTPLDPSLPFQYVANFDYMPSGFGGGTVDVELQPLALDTSSTTTPRTFFGPPLVFPAIPVTPDGTFAINVGILNVAAETNPLFFIDAQANNVVFSAQVLDADDVCGTVTGMLVFPVASPLTGTTLAAVRVLDIMPAGLPAVFPLACP